MSIKYYISIHCILLTLCLSHVCVCQNVAPSLTATGDLGYCPDSQVNIVTDFDIFDPDDTEIEALFIQISTGYVQGEDILLLTGLHPNIVTTWNANEGKLSMYGNGTPLASYTDLIAATKAIVYQSISNAPIVDKTFSITIGDANYLPITDHYYEYVPSLGITWTAARAAAASRTYFGLQGYLATIIIAEEAQLAGKQAAGAGWIGGSDAETEGTWKWVTGPEAGTVFWNGVFNGSTPNFAFWNNNEPNQFGDEDYAHITDPSIGIQGAWNDLPNVGYPSGPYQPKGYIVEYGGTPGDPILNIAASTNIRALSLPRGVPSDLDICDSMLDGDDNNGLAEFDLTLNEVNILNGEDASDYSFSYYSDPDYSDLITNPSAFANTTANSQTVYVKIESNFNANCYREHMFTINVNALPKVKPTFTLKNSDVDAEFEIEQSEIYCLDGQPVSLSAISTNASFTYQWFDGEGNIMGNNARINGVISGTYSVIATSDLGCQSPPISYAVLESSIANIEMDDVTIVELSNANSVSINNSDNNLGIGDYEFALNNVEGPYQNTPFFNNVQFGLHVLYVRDKKGCGITSLEVFISVFPKYFTPNNDGINDRWQIKGINDDFLNTSKVSIFDRYGKLIKQMNAKNGSWDGTFNGQLLPSNDYWFTAELVDNTGNIRVFKGHFSLLR